MTRTAHRLTTFGIVAGLALAVGLPTAASANPRMNDLQERIDVVLANYPGGTQIAANEISWDDGTIILTLADTGLGLKPDSVGTCATGAYCVYAGTSLTGTKLSFTACGTTVSTSALGSTVHSIANARTSGTIQAKNSSGAILTTLAAGSYTGSAPAGVTQLTCII